MLSRFIVIVALLIGYACLELLDLRARDFRFAAAMIGIFGAYLLHSAAGSGWRLERYLYYTLFGAAFLFGFGGLVTAHIKNNIGHPAYIKTGPQTRMGLPVPPTITSIRAEPLIAPDFQAPVGLRVSIELSQAPDVSYKVAAEKLTIRSASTGEAFYLHNLPDPYWGKIRPARADAQPEAAAEATPNKLTYNFYTPGYSHFNRIRQCLIVPRAAAENDGPPRPNSAAPKRANIPLLDAQIFVNFFWVNTKDKSHTPAELDKNLPTADTGYRGDIPVAIEIDEATFAQILGADELLQPHNLAAAGLYECPDPEREKYIATNVHTQTVCYCKADIKDTQHAPE